jgi:uncharacterized protein
LRIIAKMHAEGQGVPFNAADRPLADKGQLMAEYMIGLTYANNQGGPQNDGEAMKWLRKAADKGEAIAQFNVGLLYFKRLGTPKDLFEAPKWYRRRRRARRQSHGRGKSAACKIDEPSSNFRG